MPTCRNPDRAARHVHAVQVSGEMIRELGLSDEELGPISLTITNLAEKARKRRVRRASSNSSVTVSQVGTYSCVLLVHRSVDKSSVSD